MTCEACSCLVRLAQKRSRGLCAFQIFRSPYFGVSPRQLVVRGERRRGGLGGKEGYHNFLPTCGPSGVLIRTTDPAGARHAFPDRMGSVISSSNRRGAAWILAYKALSTVNGDPSFPRYAGTGVGMGLRDLRRSASSISDIIETFPSTHFIGLAVLVGPVTMLCSGRVNNSNSKAGARERTGRGRNGAMRWPDICPHRIVGTRAWPDGIYGLSRDTLTELIFWSKKFKLHSV